ncbi:unnamed protein product [Acanthoscelides obtectus]|uniref:DDE Tnp4 domain-containing protein n=1 Tax=Acanthoscelides obtectus TaxID=200917 RepID=A0A9P0JY60_ACAOB|nr:unnamed protein product [Acanthoscelides obtectus]CAK1633949.1 Putative nuclease HARBI1 [Acanthoscelides obtectus]
MLNNCGPRDTFAEFGDEYINRKGYPSINIQATCNAKEIFTSVDCQWPGSVHDSRILKNSNIFNILKNSTEECVSLGDDGYSISPWITTPWRNPTTRNSKIIITCNTFFPPKNYCLL